jgi:hypothetical protein
VKFQTRLIGLPALVAGKKRELCLKDEEIDPSRLGPKVRRF